MSGRTPGWFGEEAGQTMAAGPPVVFLPGWGFDGRILTIADQCLPWLAPDFFLDPASFPAMLLDYLERRNLPKIRLVGWSMGGNLALDFAVRHPERVAALYLLAVRRAWPRPELEEIRAQLAAEPRSFMISFYRKCFLGEKARYQRFAAQLQEDYLATLDPALLRRGLDFLETMPAGTRGAAPVGETFCFHGRKDVIAPVAEMAAVEGAECEIAPQGGHLFFLSQDFRLPVGTRKKALRQRFSKAAATYDSYAEVQKTLADQLVHGLPAAKSFAAILELGCGTGNLTRKLATLYPQAEIIACDFSEEMLRVGREKLSRAGVHFVCEDGEHLLAAGQGTFELIVSNAAMQWFDDLEASFFHVRRRLRSNGLFRTSIFGPRTLSELARGLAALSGSAASIPAASFADQERLRGILAKYFRIVRIEPWQGVKRYGSIQGMLTPIARTGTSGWQVAGRPPLTRQRLKHLAAWFEAEYGGYQLTYQAFLISCEP